MIIIETTTTPGGEVAAGVWIGMTVIDTVGGREITAVEAGVAVLVLIMTEVVGKGDIMMIGAGVGVGHLRVPPLVEIVLVHGEVCLLARNPPLGVKVQTGAAMMKGLQPLRVFHHGADLLILEALLLVILTLMSDAARDG